MAEPLITYRGTIYPWQCDHVGHMNVMWYVGKFDEATWQFFNALGLPPSYLRTARRGMAAVDQQAVHLDTDARKSCALADAIVAKAASLLAGA